MMLSSHLFHPIGRKSCTSKSDLRQTRDDKDGQEAWFTARIASLIG